MSGDTYWIDFCGDETVYDAFWVSFDCCCHMTSPRSPRDIPTLHSHVDVMIAICRKFIRSILWRQCVCLCMYTFTLQSDALTLNTTSPDFSNCFQQTVLTWVPSVFLLLTCCCYVPHCWSYTPETPGRGFSRLGKTQLVGAGGLRLLECSGSGGRGAGLSACVHAQAAGSCSTPLYDHLYDLCMAIFHRNIAWLCHLWTVRTVWQMPWWEWDPGCAMIAMHLAIESPPANAAVSRCICME